MTEDINDQSTGQPAGGAEETAPTPAAGTTGEAIALPATTQAVPVPPGVPQGVPLGMAQGMPNDVPQDMPREVTHEVPQGVDPVTAPGGAPVDAPAATGITPPQGSYAMGALAGNPMLGETPAAGASYGSYASGAPYGAPSGPPTDPNAPTWAPPLAGGAAGRGDHKFRNGVLAGAAAVAVLAAGVGIGSAVSSNSPSSLSATGASNGARIPSGSGSGSAGNGFNGSGGNPFGNGSPFGGSTGNSGNSGNSGGAGSSSSGAGGPSDTNAIASKVDPGLVDVNTSLGYQSEQAAGTGIVLTSNGVILTNNHVIDGATSISVTDVGNQKTYTASVVGYDRTKDIAVLQLHNASGLQTASLADSSNVSVGQQVVGIGNAGGTGGTPSAAGGTVTALNQSITASDQGDGTSEQLSGLIQTNADIQPGDSGGSLVNTSGQVIGVDTAASAGYSFQYNGQSAGNQGFAIPINTALSIAHTIEAGNASSTVHIGETAFLGVDINPSGSSSTSGGDGNFGGGFGGGFFGGNSGSTGNTGNTGSSGSGSSSGASVAGVVTNGPAQEAGLAEGDTITSIGGKSVNSSTDLTNDMGIYHPGDKVQIGWTDTSGQSHTATVQLSSGPPQ